MPSRRLPSNPPGFSPAFERYYEEANNLARRSSVRPALRRPTRVRNPSPSLGGRSASILRRLPSALRHLHQGSKRCHTRGGTKSKCSRAARERTELGFGICAKFAAEVRSRFSIWSTKMRFCGPGWGPLPEVLPVPSGIRSWAGARSRGPKKGPQGCARFWEDPGHNWDHHGCK
jgi:hypothetical protein